ncbi:PspA/IM30 family protein (plasmid) [Rhizobium lusitanum]|uniref:PspA/IM30 family protein n=1 Tax=Rhizobium lusitanum TaxID=293958 RepID=UPI00162166D4|nr:PspA/IM30 family protein [Rhizobium lusitanum]QND46439.1 PspA/IM30 family protein [Rhizobium lusitanum]
MFNLIVTLLRGRAYDAEQAFVDRHAMPLLSQQIRDAAQRIQYARHAVAVAIAQNDQEKKQYATILARIADLETRALAALAQHSEDLARDAADAIAYLEAERDTSEKAQAQFTTAITKLKAILRTAEARLQELQRGERLARATQEAQKLDIAVAGSGLATLDEAEETLGRLRDRQHQSDTIASVLRDMDSPSRTAGIVEKLANAGCGAPLRSSADDVLARLRARTNDAA